MNRYEFIEKFQDQNYDPFVAEYSNHLNAINLIVSNLGKPLEGNIFYYDRTESPSISNINPAFLHKRRLYALLAMISSNVLEIGFNAGHSALLMLTSNPDLTLTSIDFCYHSYTVDCYRYLRSTFGERISLIESDSNLVLPTLKNDYDCFIIDGGHETKTADLDIFNVINYSKKGSLIVIDDTQMLPIKLIVNMYMLKGWLTPVSDPTGYIPNSDIMVFFNSK